MGNCTSQPPSQHKVEIKIERKYKFLDKFFELWERLSEQNGDTMKITKLKKFIELLPKEYMFIPPEFYLLQNSYKCYKYDIEEEAKLADIHLQLTKELDKAQRLQTAKIRNILDSFK